MRVLLCTPYVGTPHYVPGGISIWAKNILQYYRILNSDIQVTPISFDRRYSVRDSSSMFARLVYGVKDYYSSIENTRKELRNNIVDVLHLCTSAQLSLYKDLYVLKMAKHYGARAVVHFHFGRIPELIESRNAEYRLLMKVCKTADSIIVMDKRSEDALKRIGFNNVYNLPNPLSIEITEQISSMQETINRIPNKLLFVGAVIRTKGVYELVEACKQFDGIELHIVGSVDDIVKSDITSIASSKDNGNWVKLRGQISHYDVLKEMMSASVFAFPSYTEGFPNVILEAMACGCPIVTTTVGAIPEMLDIGHGQSCGICVAPQDTQVFAEGLKVLLSNHDYASNCAENAKKRVNKLYSMPVVWNQLTDIWTKTI